MPNGLVGLIGSESGMAKWVVCVWGGGALLWKEVGDLTLCNTLLFTAIERDSLKREKGFVNFVVYYIAFKKKSSVIIIHIKGGEEVTRLDG